MRIKTLIAVSVVACAFAALPASGMADPNMDLPKSSGFTVSGGTSELTGGTNVHCASVSGSGTFENGSVGALQFVFHGCKALGFLSCTTAGQPSGTIVTTVLPFNLRTVGGNPAVLVYSKEGHFMTFSCLGATFKVTGKGVVGTLLKPGYKEASKTFEVEFKGTGAVQNHLKVDGDANTYTLESSVNGGAPAAAALDASGVATWDAGGEGTLTK
jgi:hypothetical protein